MAKIKRELEEEPWTYGVHAYNQFWGEIIELRVERMTMREFLELMKRWELVTKVRRAGVVHAETATLSSVAAWGIEVNYERG